MAEPWDYRTSYERFLMHGRAPIVCAAISYGTLVATAILLQPGPVEIFLSVFITGIAYSYLTAQVRAVRLARKFGDVLTMPCLRCGSLEGWAMWRPHRRRFWWRLECRACAVEVQVGLMHSGIRVVYEKEVANG